MGIILALASAVLASSKDVVSKYLAARVSATASTFASFTFAIPFYVVALAVAWRLGFETFTFSGIFWSYVVLRSLTDACAESFKMKALSLGDLSLVANFFALYPIFLLVTSPLITGDPITRGGVVGIVCAVLGALLVIPRRANDSPCHHDTRAILFALGAALMFSLNTAFDRAAVMHGTPLFSGFAMTLLAGMFLLPSMIHGRDKFRELSTNPKAFWGRGLLELLFMVTKLSALQYLTAPEVVAIQRISLLLSIVGGGLVFGERDFARRLIAGALVIVGVASAIAL